MPAPSPQHILDEVRKWKHNRSVYPGWLIAPETVRTTLRRQTEQWAAHFLAVRSALSPAQELDILYEINWRLEIALIPLWTDLLPAYEHVLGTINPFPQDIIDLPAATWVLCDANAHECDWSAVRRQWLSLAFALLRFHREERQIDAFDVLHIRLDRLGDVVGDVRARWCYERCLLALGEMDDESVVHALDQWPCTTHDVFWLVRKAAMLAEIGQTQQALELNSAALAKLREGLRDATEHIPGLSREGWALLLGLALRSNQRWLGVPGDELADREEIRRRFKQLKTYGCDPDEISDYFKSRLEQPAPTVTPAVETTPGFEPGTVSRTIHMGSDLFTKLFPAYGFCRIVEEVAQPPCFGHVSLCKESIAHAGEWLAEHDPVRTQSIMLRLQDEKLVDRYLSRHRVAALRPEVIARLKLIARRAIDQSLPRAPAAVRSKDDNEMRAASRLECAIDLISRVSIREPESGLGDLWEGACNLYRAQAIRAGLSFSGPLREFFSNLIEATPKSQLIEQMPTLLRLPVAFEGEFGVAFPDRWPDPVTMIAHRLDSSCWQRPPSWLGDVKRRLIHIARNGPPQARRLAFIRLLKLNELGILSASDGRTLAHIFWGAATPKSGLPMETWQFGTPWFAMGLPESADARERVRQYILSYQVGDVHGGMVFPEACFDLILHATETSHRADHPACRWYIAWTKAEIRFIFNTLQAWWENHGRRIATELRQINWKQAHDGSTIMKFMNRFWDVLRIVIIPRMERRESAVKAVVDLISDIQSTGLPVGAVLPATLMLRPNTMTQVVSRLRQEFANPALEYYLSALRGIVYWAEQSRDTRSHTALPPVPSDLLREISMAIALRRPESLRLCLDWALNVLRRLGQRADGQFVRNLLIGLDYLLGETAYQAAARGDARHRYEDIPNLRVQAGRLAKCLSDCGYGDDPIIRRWSEALASDPLPEIRRIATEGAISGS